MTPARGPATRALLGALALAAALLAPLALAAASASGGGITLGLALEPPNLDPTATSAEATQDVVYGNLFEGLTRITEEGRVAPALAQRWTVSDDGLHYRFYLRGGVHFHDGTPFSAIDVRYSLDRARAPGSTNPLRDLLGAVREVRVVDERTLDIELTRPVAELLTYLGWGNLVVLSPASAAHAATAPVGTGPFRFAAWRKGDAIVLDRNPTYWGTPARLDRVTFRIVSDASSALAALLAGDVDGYSNFPAPENVAALARDTRFTVSVGSTEGETLLAINNARAPFNDVRVRRALAHAIDRRAIITGAMYGYGQPIGSHFPPHDAAYVDLTGRYGFDPPAARQLLREAGYPNGFAVTLRLPPPYYARRSGEIIASELGAIGLRVRIENVEWAQWLEQVFKNRDFDLTIVSHTEPMDYDIYARPGYYFGYHDARYDARLEELSRNRDEEARRRLLGDLQRQLADDCVNVYLFELPKLGVWRRDLHGLWRESPVQGVNVSGAWLDAPGADAAGAPRIRTGATVLVGAGVVLLALAGFALRRHVSARFLAGRGLSLALTILAASIVIFVLVSVLPGDPAAYMMGLSARPDAIAHLRAEYGLDVPAWQQYAHWIGGLLHGDLGTSYTYRVPVAELVGERLAVSLPLALLALALSIALALPLALMAAARPGGPRDRLLMGLAQVGLALPNFWLGLLLILVFAVHLHLLPAGGFPGWDAGTGTALAALALPAISLAVPQACILARVLRAELGSALAEDYVRTARAKGLGTWRTLWRHALPNAAIPALTVIGLQFSFLLAGSIIVETVYGLPGLGRLLFQATAQRDLIVVRSVVLLLVATVVVVNVAVELLYAIVDPRLRTRDAP
jgi:ABC-type dipeptide/oligopeptide/nickel transport system permease component/ABC-type transport system substrate-binding protein